MSTPLFRIAALAYLTVASVARADSLPAFDLPEGLHAELAAGPPLVQHPIMASLGEPGVMYVGDAPGLNLNKAELEKQLPNRVLRLHDTNGDGIYDQVTVFADKMTFPQGGVWLDGSLYVASPPGIWKLTDTNGDGVADQREMIAGYFDFTGNAADVHGPFLHPNGRLYWCHGRKGHDVKQKDGTPVHAGLASGIWSCRPDGSDIRWHSLGCGDNPVEIDFTPEGEIVGVQNIFFTNPRGDTIVHWLPGGVYPREDQLKAIAGLPRTLDAMPVVHNFGHTAVSGCSFYRSGALDPAWRGNFFVVHFNTQRVTRMELLPNGATYRIAQHEFLKLKEPDAHLTDVLEDRDGSLLVLNTGGWFRIGCPSSLVAKPDVGGAIYRVRKTGTPNKVEPWGAETVHVWELARRGDEAGAQELAKLLADKNESVARAAGNALAGLRRPDTEPALIAALGASAPGTQLAAAHALGELPQLGPKAISALLEKLSAAALDPAIEHQAMYALIRAHQPEPLRHALSASDRPALQRRALMLLEQLPDAALEAAQVLPLLESGDEALAKKAADLVAHRQEWVPAAAADFQKWLAAADCAPARLALLEQAAKPWVAEAPVRALIGALLESSAPARQRTGWSLLAATSGAPEPNWVAPALAALTTANPGDLPLALDGAARLRTPVSREALSSFAADTKHPLRLRLKALGASGAALTPDSFEMLTRVLSDPAAGSARLEAARILSKAKFSREQLLRLAPLLQTLNSLELRELAKVLRQSSDPAIGAAFATALKTAPALAALQESEVRSLLSAYPPEVFGTVAPAIQALAAEDDARRRKLETLPALVLTQGRPAEGRKVYESGRGACIGCHRIGEIGNNVGPNLSTIGQIRTERDILESILLPSATLARDYEAQTIETADGQTIIGVLRRNLPESVVIADATGQERELPRARIISMQALPVSLMPAGLDHTLTEPELLDLVAYLRSRK